MIIILRTFTLLLALMQSFFALLPSADKTHKMSLNETKTFQEFEGFGTSGCWWAQMINSESDADMLAKALYDDESGLGLQIYRYNIGGGEADNPDSRITNEAKRRTESFYVKNPETGEYGFDFSKDANARRVLDKALEYGAEGIILFCNSPHFSMTLSGHASGGFTDGVSNLPRENYQEFVDYLLTIADWFVSQGYPIIGISPVNEPNWGWGGEWVGQEGCHYTAKETADLLSLFAREMVSKNVPYKLMGPELGDLSSNYYSYQALLLNNKDFLKVADSLDAHSYWNDHNIMKKWRIGAFFEARYPDLKFNMTEWCELPCSTDAPSIESAMYMANIIAEDLTLLNAVTWQSWVAVAGPAFVDGKNITDGLICEYDNFTRFETCKRYYAFKHFSSFIKPGALRIELADNKGFYSKITSAAFKDGDKIIMVLVNNEGADASIALSGKYSSMQIFTSDSAINCAETFSGDFKNNITLAKDSISTIILTK